MDGERSEDQLRPTGDYMDGIGISELWSGGGFVRGQNFAVFAGQAVRESGGNLERSLLVVERGGELCYWGGGGGGWRECVSFPSSD